MQINKKKLIISTSISLIFLSCILYFSLFFTCIFKSDDFDSKKADAIIVLGYSYLDDENPSYYATKRLETALDLYNEGYAKNIIVTGGIGPTDEIPVAVSMKKWFIDKGVPSELIYSDNLSNNTYENFVFSKEICDKNNFKDVIVVTNDYHMYRSMVIANEFFEKPSGEEAIVPVNLSKVIVYIKEPLSLIKYELVNKNTSKEVLENIKATKAFSIIDKYNIISKNENITNYNIDVEYVDNKFIVNEKITFKNTYNKSIDTIKLNLYHNRLKQITNSENDYIAIKSINVGNKTLSFQNNSSYVDIVIPTLKPNKEITLDVNFETTIPTISYMTGSNKENVWAIDFFPVVAEFKDGAFINSSYNIETAYNDISNYNVTFKTDKNLNVILPNNYSFYIKDNKKITKMDNTLLRNFSFSICNNVKTTSLISDENISINMFYKGDIEKLYSLFYIVEKSMNYMNNEIGSYTYNNLNIVIVSLDKPKVSYGSGMIFVDQNFLAEPNIKNELLYATISQWFGSVVSSDLSSSYINIGLSRLISDFIYNDSLSDNEHFNNEFLLLYKNIGALKTKDINSVYENYYFTKHLKSKLMLYSLSNILEDNWIDFLRQYYQIYSFGNVTEEDFKILCKEFSKKDLTSFFEQWLNTSENFNTQGGKN